MNTKDAKALLEAANLKRGCDHAVSRQECKACRKYLRLRSEKGTYEAKRRISRLGFTPATLRVAIKLAAVAKDAHQDCPCDTAPGIACTYRGALAEWEAL
jgi:hypothetical protein